MVFLDELTKHGLMEHVANVGRHAGEALHAMASRLPAVKEVRGAGLIWGIELDRPAAPVVEAALERGLLINRTADTVIRLLPPYVMTASEFDEGVATLEEAIAACTQGSQA
jgi:acetylornithine/succinyldiaminopimelate/putrescine aminotransferase